MGGAVSGNFWAYDSSIRKEKRGARPMTQKTFSLVASVIFLLVAIGHLSRLVFRWSISLGGWPVPLWINGVALLISAYLAYEGFLLAKKSL
jgi:hypothetical protein